MDQQLKQRLVGVAVIFLLAIIFVPMLLDGAGKRPRHLQVEIPPQPDIEPFEVLEPKIIELKREVASIPQLQPRIVDEISDPPGQEAPAIKAEPEPETEKARPKVVAKQAAKPQTKPAAEPVKAATKSVQPLQSKTPAALKPAPIPATKPAAKIKTGGETWIIQAGSFNDKDKAYALRNKLRKSRLASDVFIEKFPHDGKISYRVRLGMFLTRNKARVVANKLRAKYNIKGLVQKYDK